MVVDECSATTWSERSVRAKAASITTTQIVNRAANAYTARRAESVKRRSPRVPASAATPP